jgi:hypothetical protein
MVSNRYNIKRGLVSFILALSLLAPSFLPVFTPRAHAFVDLATTKMLLLRILDGIAMTTAQKLVDKMVKDTVKWANKGFDGNPAFITNPRQFFSDTADGVAGSFIAGSDLGFLCSPFQNSIRISLAQQYYEAPEEQFQCTLSDAIANIDAFYEDFNEGGWDAWFSMTQTPTNNPYGAYLTAKVELDTRIANAIGAADDEKKENQGFLSVKSCNASNPSAADIEAYETGNYGPGSIAQQIADGTVKYDETKSAGTCIEDGPIRTAGNTIKAQLDRVLPSGLEKLITVEHVEQLITAFASGLLQRYVFNSEGSGVFGDSSLGTGRTVSNETIDVDGDEIPDGYDYDGDGELDICHHGSKDELQAPSNENCYKSTEVENSPFFIPLCEALEAAGSGLSKYLDFVRRNVYESIYSNTWLGRTINANGTVDTMINAVNRYEIMEYDKALFTLGQYGKFLDMLTRNLSEGRLGFKEAGVGPSQGQINQMFQQMLIRNTGAVIDYLVKFKNAMGQCESPNAGAINDIEPPVLEDESSISTSTPPTTGTTTPQTQ